MGAQELSKLPASNTCGSIGWVAAVARFMRIVTAGACTTLAESVSSMQCKFKVELCAILQLVSQSKQHFAVLRMWREPVDC